MLKTIDLRQAERAAETEMFRAAVSARSASAIGVARFVASGSQKTGAPIRPSLTEGDFTASGQFKGDK